MRIRRAGIADAAGIAAVHVASSRAAYPEPRATLPEARAADPEARATRPEAPPGEDAVDRRRAVWERILAQGYPRRNG